MRDLTALRTYSVGSLFLGRYQPRWAMLLLFWVVLAPTIVLLPLAIIMSRRYRLSTDASGLKLVCLGTVEMKWVDIHGYGCKSVTYQRRRSMCVLTVEGRGRSAKVVMTAMDGDTFRAELTARGIAALR